MKYFILGIFLFVVADALGQSDSLSSSDTIRHQKLQEIIVTASKTEEKLLQAPVSIEKLNLMEIRNSGQPTFFEAIGNLKGIQMITPSLGFKVINARGFTNTTNVRFVQMVDGVDNQAPHIGAPIANSLGPNELDIYRVEIVPGSASAVYGMNAINGAANFITKDPFNFQGFSFQQRSGVNHIGDKETDLKYFNESSFRWAKKLNNQFAVKFNGSFMKGTDWYATTMTDLNPKANTSTGLLGAENVGKDLVNNYGDESSNRRTISLGGKQYVVSRTGYSEQDVTSYNLQNIKGDASFYYRPNEKIEVSYLYRFAYMNNVYQRTNRFRFDDYLTQQHVLTAGTKSIRFKTYLTTENTGESYNIRSMAENVERSFKSDDAWYKDFTTQYNNSVTAGKTVQEAMGDARNFADKGRPEPGSKEMKDQIAKLRDINNWDYGAALKVKAYLAHTEIQHNLTDELWSSLRRKHKININYGLDFREYIIVPDGNYFINPVENGQNLTYWKTGGFVQATKLLFNEKVKINAVLRVDKNQYYKAKFNPRLAVVYTPVQNHNFRVSYQNGYRFPSIFEAFSNINSGGVKRVGGLPVMSNGIFENSYLRSSIDAFQAAVTNDVNKNGLTQAAAIEKNKGLLKKNTYTYLQPEQVSSIEAGYRTCVLNKTLTFDVDFYYNIYNNLMAQVEANMPKTSNADSVAYYLNDKKKQDKYRLWTNSKTVSYNYGGTAGVSYLLPQNFVIGGNVTFAKLYRRDQQDGLEDGFNTPKWMYNISLGNPRMYKSLGFNINYRNQSGFLWQSALATGTVPSYSTVDAQAQYNLMRECLNIKLGGTNIFNKYYYTFLGGPSVGAFYYIAATINL
ncbi:MAG: TonB-dependent receptor [Sporocytophaga sp.]|uniref:TonB-dependent receptor n=1 Tax=Sporocytophaga sp. TaxID=2231183 RepID=UPI001B09708D|nr:TonB-dependent receptor [Sporocytophaga sp.]MBO9702753.1 TonB-dependent receptor [Sporocytophaga sp.]